MDNKKTTKTIIHYTLDRITQTFLSPHALWYTPTRKDDEWGGASMQRVWCRFTAGRQSHDRRRTQHGG